MYTYCSEGCRWTHKVAFAAEYEGRATPAMGRFSGRREWEDCYHGWDVADAIKDLGFVRPDGKTLIAAAASALRRQGDVDARPRARPHAWQSAARVPGAVRRSERESAWPNIARASRSIPATERRQPDGGRFGGPHRRPARRSDDFANHEDDKAATMTEAQVHKVRFEPVGVEMEVEEGETVLDAAFRQGISLMHGCKEGQCGSCKSQLVDGDIELLKYSTFALPDYESETGHVLLCRTHAFSDVSVELLNYDEDLLSRSIAVKEFPGRVAKISALTPRHQAAGDRNRQAAEILGRPICRSDASAIGAITRAFSMANAPGEGTNLQLHHQEISQRRVLVPARRRVERRRRR